MAIQGQDITYNINQLQDLLDKVNNLGDATTETAGLMSAEDKQKVDNAITQETDPTVPSWAKASDKPSYSASEVGAVPTTRKVNNKALSADVTLSASDVGALPEDTELFSGSYDDLTDKPTIPAEQIQSDWNQSNTSAKDYIKNKPTIPDISNCITKSPTSGLVKNDGTIDTSTYLTSQLYTSAYCYSGSNERYKKAYCSGFSGFRDKGYIQMIIAQGNGCNADFYISINESGSRRVYIDGVASSSTNYNLQAGSYIVYFDTNNYYFNTDGTIPRVLHTSSTSGLVKNDGTIDTNTYLTQHQDISNYVQKSSTSGLLKNDGTVDTSTYLTSAHEVPSGGNAGQVLSKNSATDYDVHWVSQTTTYPSAYCTTAGGTALKVANCSLWTATANTYLHILMGVSNTYQGELKLKVNSNPSVAGAPIYINGVVSSSTNYTLPSGSYIIFYDGTNFYFNTDATIPNVLHKSSTSGLVKNDGSIDTNTYLTQHQDISNYVQKSNTTGLLKNDGSVDTNTYLTSAPVTSVNGQTGAVSLTLGDANVIETVKVNGSALTPDANKAVDITVPSVSGKEDTTNKVTSLSSSSTDTQYPSAKCVYDLIGDIETLLAAI